MNRFNINTATAVAPAVLITVLIFTSCQSRDVNRVSKKAVEGSTPDSIQACCATLPEKPYMSRLPAHPAVDPQGPDEPYDPMEPFTEKRVVRGGSFLCSDQYCSGFRNAARMKTSWDTGLEHTGFRCVISADQ